MCLGGGVGKGLGVLERGRELLRAVFKCVFIKCLRGNERSFSHLVVRRARGTEPWGGGWALRFLQ